MNAKKYIEEEMFRLLRKKSIEKIKVNEIVREVGSCKGTFYKYYRDKYELLISCFRNLCYDELVAKADGWEKFVYGCLTVFEKDVAAVINAFDSADVNSLRFYHEKIIYAYLENSLRASGVPLNKLNLFSMRLCAAAFTDEMLRWLASGRTESKDELILCMRAAMPNAIAFPGQIACYA